MHFHFLLSHLIYKSPGVECLYDGYLLLGRDGIYTVLVEICLTIKVKEDRKDLIGFEVIYQFVIFGKLRNIQNQTNVQICIKSIIYCLNAGKRAHSKII